MPGPARRRMPAGHAIVVVVVALGVGALLNAPALSAAADSRPFGWGRTLSIVATAPFEAVAGLLRLDRAHVALSTAAAAARGEEAPSVTVAAGARPDRAQPQPHATTGPGSAGAADESQQVAGDPVGVTPAGSTPSPVPVSISRRRPLRVWVGGDSLASEFAPALADRLSRTDKARVDIDFRFSTGLSRPDFFDWPAQLSNVVATAEPDVFVVVFGANDAQNLAVDGEVLDFGTKAWDSEYATRVGALMDELTSAGASVYWLGQPVMRAEDFDRRMRALNALYEEQARERDAVHYVDTRRLFAVNGRYSPYVDGDLLRQQDGIHLTRAGGELLADHVVDLLSERWPLRRSRRS